MHLIFERPTGRYKSNCNILALAWMPYYNETQFRQTLFDYHQGQLINLTNSVPIPSSRDDNHVGQLARGRNAIRDRARAARDRSLQANDGPEREANGANPNGNQQKPTQPAFLNSRVAELHQRYLYLKNPKPSGLTNTCESTYKLSGASISDDLDQKYGRQSNFGWLAIGNVGKIVGVTLTSLVPTPQEKLNDEQASDDRDLIKFNEDNQQQQQADNKPPPPPRPDRSAARYSYNLRGHRDEIILVRWNELYQKLATIDSKGNVLIWCKVNEKFTIQTPFYNRTKTVADFKWSNDGKTALICYTDSFILVGSSSGQRHWHSMLNLDDYHITCASWTPNDDQLILGVSNGNVVVIDLPGSELTEIVINQTNIRTMCWSTSDISLSSIAKLFNGSLRSNSYRNNQASARPSPATAASSVVKSPKSSNIVNQRRLSRDCSVFSRFRLCSQGPIDSARSPVVSTSMDVDENDPSETDIDDGQYHCNILAIDFADGTIKLYQGGLSDPTPKTIQVNQESYIMQWSSNGRVLAVAGFNIHTSAPSVGFLRCRYLNSVKFYNPIGQLIYEQALKHTRYPITAFTWGHEDKRIFVATGPRLHCARVSFFGEVPLSLLAMSSIQRHTMIPDKAEVIENILKGHYGMNILNWQSSNCPIDIQKEVQRFKVVQDSSYSSLLMMDTSEGEDGTKKPAALCHNSSVYQYRLPQKLLAKVDELFSRTLRQPFDENWTLGDCVWHVPRDKRRYYCTLICYTCEQELGQGLQYRTAELIDHNRGMSDNHTSDQNKIFVLYIECEGSLVPILKARRVGFLKPEFVIFDPEDNQSRLHRQYKVSDIPQQLKVYNLDKDQLGRSPDRQNKFPADILSALTATPSYYGAIGSPDYGENCAELHSYPDPRASLASLGQQSVCSDAEHYYNFECDSENRKNQIKFADNLRKQRSQYKKPLAPLITSLTDEQYLMYYLDLKPGKQATRPTRGNQQLVKSKADQCSTEFEELKRAISRYRMRGSQTASNNLPENSELVRIKSNIWGTKFKLYNMGNRVVRQRSVLGSVVYKASILHLQPRQIFLTIKDMSNYCCLCSKHHHTTIPSKLDRRNVAASRQVKAKDEPNLLDMPNAEMAPGILRAEGSYGRRSGNSSSRTKRANPTSGGSKVLIPVGDSIRIVPKLERNQVYRLAGSLSDEQQPSTSSGRGKITRPSGSSITFDKPIVNKRQQQPTRDDHDDDDMLTLSLDASNKYEIDMTAAPRSTSSTSCREDRMDQFLASNKTLKSIQTITQMIVDLSSKADDDETTISTDEITASPSKLIKVDNHEPGGVSLASLFVPPETPVHRPRRTATSKRGTAKGSASTQSATTTPLKSFLETSNASPRKRSRQSRRESHETALGQLPPPPPAVPFSRRLSTSAKRFFDGSLRSLYLTNSYSTHSDVEPEEYEPLVTAKGQSTRLPNNRALSRCTSQPSTPLGSQQLAINQLYNLKAQLLRKLRGDGVTGSGAGRENNRRPKSSFANGGWSANSNSRKFRSTNSTTTSGQLETEAGAEQAGEGTANKSDSRLKSFANWSDSSSENNSNLSADDDNNSDFSDLLDSDLDDSDAMNNLRPAVTARQQQATLQTLATPLRRQAPKTKTQTHKCKQNDHQSATGSNADASRRRQRQSKRQRRKSICPNPSCCCAKELKLNNRPPVWNELSQVYQLDFGGRVTQESAKNLQIDFEGNLVSMDGAVRRLKSATDRWPVWRTGAFYLTC